MKISLLEYKVEYKLSKVMLTVRTRTSRRTSLWCKYFVRNVEVAQISVTRWLSFPSEARRPCYVAVECGVTLQQSF